MELTLSTVLPFAMASARDDEEARLIARSAAGDPDAFAAVVRRHERRVFRLAGRFFRQRADVEDTAQETFLIAWRKLGTYRGEAPFESWLTRVCLNACYARLKAAKPAQPLFEIDLATSDPSPDVHLEVERLLATLSPDDRFVLLMLDGEGWSVAEIAEKLGWTRINVRVRAHRARRKLRARLEGSVR
jgi:RNA polymerase sigma-70 factor (ECF subfamily)